jgi:hypothetical protein
MAKNFKRTGRKNFMSNLKKEKINFFYIKINVYSLCDN